MKRELATDIAALAARLGSAALEKACTRLEAVAPGTKSLVALADAGQDFAPWASSNLLSLAARKTNAAGLALALRSAAIAVETTRQEAGIIDLVWSGPDGGLAAVRSLEQALRDLILSAKSELWLVSFAAFRVPHLLAALQQAANRGVALNFLLETADDSEGQLTVDARNAFGFGPEQAVRFHAWPAHRRPRNAAGRPAKLHAKFAIADRQIALISSANLTADALERNMEAGVIARGGRLPACLAEHLDLLIARGHVVPADD